MKPFEVVADRFVIERLAGQGGMGSVYRATDRLSGEIVALKIIDQGTSSTFDERFVREARALASVSHPAIVRYVAEGSTPKFHWLAMEWLEGEDLDARLERGRLDLPSAIAMLTRASDGMAAAHAQRVIHRDLKPSNLFLMGGDPRAVKVIDFGVARMPERARPLTKTGQMVGTVGFMSPEQIHGERDLDERADIFALGAVLFESVTGRPAFGGATLIAVIAKVLREDPPRPSDIDPRIPAALDELILSMLAKPRASRPATAAEVAARLREIGELVQGDSAQPVSVARSSVTGREQHLVSVILVVPPSEEEEDVAMSQRSTRVMGAAPMPPPVDTDMKAAIDEVASDHGADALELGDGAHLIIVGTGGTAKDQAARAASSALALRARLATAKIAIGTGLAEPTGGLPVGPAIDRAAALIEHSPTDGGGDAAGIAIDEVTAALLDDRFEVTVRLGTHQLTARTQASRSSPPAALASKGTPFVGRDKEMSIMEALLNESLDEPVARTVVVTGQPGAGKSRLRREFLSRALSKEGGSPIDVIVARADVVGSGSALSLVRAIVERLARVPEGSRRDVRAKQLGVHLRSLVEPGLDLQHAREFLGELIGAPTEEPPSPELVTARNEPRGLAEWLRRSFADLVRRHAERGPLMIVLEDLHWGDEGSIEFIADASRQAESLPLFVFALGRPEVWDALPRLREVLAPQEIRLAGLTPRAAQRLLEAALGGRATTDLVARIVARADGNPFFLEELARSATEDGAAAPETVLAVVQSRIQRLDPEARRLLRAASVFGRSFRREGIAGLLGLSASSTEMGELLEHLVNRDLIEKTGDSFAFRHDLVREAAYAMLPESERARAHRLAAEWLELMGHNDPEALAEHFERAGEPGRAVEWLVRAAELAHNAGSYDRVVGLTERALRAGASGGTRGNLRIVEAFARAWLHDWPGSHTASSDALSLLPTGSTSWFRAASVHTFACVSIGDAGSVGALTAAFIAHADRAEASAPYAFAAYALLLVLSLVGKRAEAQTILGRLDARGDSPALDPGFVVWRAFGHAHMNLAIPGNPGLSLRHLERAARFAPNLADSIVRVVLTYFSASSRYDAGDTEGGLAGARTIVEARGPEAVPYLKSWSQHVVARAHMIAGRLDEALAIANSLARDDDALFSQRARSLLAQVHLARGLPDQAEAAANAVISGTFSPQDVVTARAILARIHTERGEHDQAIAHVTQANEVTLRFGSSAPVRSLLGVVEVEALLGRGDRGRAIAVLRDAIARLWSIHKDIADPQIAAHWPKTRDNARLLALEASLGTATPG